MVLKREIKYPSVFWGNFKMTDGHSIEDMAKFLVAAAYLTPAA